MTGVVGHITIKTSFRRNVWVGGKCWHVQQNSIHNILAPYMYIHVGVIKLYETMADDRRNKINVYTIWRQRKQFYCKLWQNNQTVVISNSPDFPTVHMFNDSIRIKCFQMCLQAHFKCSSTNDYSSTVPDTLTDLLPSPPIITAPPPPTIFSHIRKLPSGSYNHRHTELSLLPKFHQFSHSLITKIGSQIVVALWCILSMEQPC
jgi:hypothetical protein